jgi:hypothetical protein
LSAAGATFARLGLRGDQITDIEFDGVTLSTMDDGVGTTTGEQNTDVDFQNFLSFMPDIVTPTASFSLNSLVTNGSASVVGNGVNQHFLGGIVELFDPLNVLLLSATVNSAVLSGNLGSSATGNVGSTSLGTITGGSLAPLMRPNTFFISVSLSNIDSGSGLSVSGGGGTSILDPFVSYATVTLSAEQVPEPTAWVLIMTALPFVRRRH